MYHFRDKWFHIFHLILNHRTHGSSEYAPVLGGSNSQMEDQFFDPQRPEMPFHGTHFTTAL